MSILDIDKLPEDTTPKQLYGIPTKLFYRKTIDRAGETLYDDVYCEVIRSKEEFDAFFGNDKGVYDDTVLCPDNHGTPFEDLCKQYGTKEFFESSVLIIMVKYSDGLPQAVKGSLFLTHDNQFMFSGDVCDSAVASGVPGYYGIVLSVSHGTYVQNNVKIKSEIILDYMDRNKI